MSCEYCEDRGRRGHHGAVALGGCSPAELDVWLEETLEALEWAETARLDEYDEAWVKHLELRHDELRAAGAQA